MWKRWLPGADSLLLRSLRGTEWGQLADYVSPSFFEVLRAGDILARARALAANARDREGFRAAVVRTGAVLAERGVSLRVAADWPDGADVLAPAGEAARRRLGQRILEAYFAQITGAPGALLDLRAARFTGSADAPVWVPQRVWLDWDPVFLAAVRDLYGGFYGDDDARFRDALERLHLGAAEDVFRSQFGEGSQRAVRFEAKAFHATFHEAFVRCRDAGRTLHPDFLALGVHLACLYDALERLALAFDVREAWTRAAA